MAGWAGCALRGLAPIVILGAVWEAAPRAGVLDRDLLPPLSAVLSAWPDLA